ncbi:glycosyltransferase family 2 protein [Acinetobacter indicus]|uniref:glycosyltransferase family 2 protein n=1 Tax=Acinetobacter indicus TaxID=756892 RepID=UPI002575BB8F|nr:glycosyltransferase family 2 protein [Acinetobacter indicus]MDM1272369.1 glycosyltransferase family 2 protein [Acinetobacter indicus]
MNSIILSIVIPTYNRPQYLPRAVESALQAAADGNVEVIVVPNGGDQSWQSSLFNYLNNSRVIISPIETGNANAARNHGMKLAKGKYIRFLDDDDYFYPNAAKKQLMMLKKSNADICAGSLAVVNHEGHILNILKVDYQEDFVAHILSFKGRTSPQFYIYRRSAIEGFLWDESINIGQDTHWTHTMCRVKDWSWICIDEVVSSWVQHSSEQLSNGYKAKEHLRLQEGYKWDTISILNNQNRLSSIRKKSAVEGMWALVNAGFYREPLFWGRIIKKLNTNFPNSYTNFPRYNCVNKVGMKPILYELITLPLRWLGFFRREILIKIGKRSNWN